MSAERVFAVSAGRSEPAAVMFRVSDVILATDLAEWSQPVQFKFVLLPDGTYDLLLRTVDLEGNPFSE
jgi:hypothetical protein